MELKVFVVGGSLDYANWLSCELVSNLEDANLVIFTGGEDLHPSFYNEPVHRTTSFNLTRDEREKLVFEKAKKLNKYLLGICRGSQFLCVMAGGKLVQHQEGQDYIHSIKTCDGKILSVTSSHHQAQYPWNLGKNFKVIGWTENLSAFHLDGHNKEIIRNIIPDGVECEIVYYPKIKGLAIQGHPEWMDLKSETVQYLQNLVNKFLNNEL